RRLPSTAGRRPASSTEALLRGAAADEQVLPTHPAREVAHEVLDGVSDIVGPSGTAPERPRRTIRSLELLVGRGLGEDAGAFYDGWVDAVDGHAARPDLVGNDLDHVARGRLAPAIA